SILLRLIRFLRPTCFFFASRRRHTRSKRDWSSDVCSSDLGFSEGTNELNNNFNSLFSYFKKSDRRHERLVDSFDQSFKRVQDVSQKQLDSFEVFDDSGEALKDFTTSLLTEQEAVHKSLATMTKDNKVLVSTMAEHNDTFKAVFGNELSSELSGIK